MNEKAIVTTWLFKTGLSNLNAGEGSSNLTEIKTYGKDNLPYISGQSVRHSLRKAIKRENKDEFKCTVEFPCTDIENCWLCDIFGYLAPENAEKRWSPVKVSPALGQIKEPITTDMLLRLAGDIECPNCEEKFNPMASNKAEGKKDYSRGQNIDCPKCGEDLEAPYHIRQALAHKQLIENTYKASISIDVQALGREEVPDIEGEGDEATIEGINYMEKYEDEDERKKRVRSILKGISNLSDFAAQAREMTNASPDLILVSLQEEYNHRLSSALNLDKEGEIDEDTLRTVVKDVLEIPNTVIFAGFTPGALDVDQNNIVDILDKVNDGYEGSPIKFGTKEEPFTPRQAINKAIKKVD